MEPTTVLSDFYRLRLNDALRGRLEFSARQIRNEARSPVLVTDVITLNTIRHVPVPPVDPGEMKHSALDTKSLGDTTENSIPVKNSKEPDAATAMEYAHRYRMMSRIDRADLRRRMEDRVRRSKRAGVVCPFKDTDGQCTALSIRCGDRLQFSMRESGSERAFMHRCMYDWRNRGDHVLIVDDDEKMRHFCASAFSLFLHLDASRVATAASVDQAIALLMRSKIEAKKFGLVITDILMPGRSGYDLVNELYDRNFDVEILLMKEERDVVRIPPDYRGATEILPNHPFVSGILIKPFHSETLVMEVKKLRFGGV